MGFKLLILTPRDGVQDDLSEWPARLREAIPGIEVDVAYSVGEAMELIGDADAGFGDFPAELLDQAKKLKWVSCPQAGPRAGYYHQALVESEIVVTNTRDIYNDHISAHIMAYVLAFSRGMNKYFPHQLRQDWRRPSYPTVYLPDSTAVVVGVGGIGGETARLCSEFGVTVIGVDARISEAPTGVAELYKSEDLQEVLPRGDFVIVTVPETPSTQGMFGAAEFRLMKAGSFLINIGRGATVVLDDLNEALRSGELAGAGLDVFQIEPLPPEHPLWTAPGVIITPHVAGEGPYLFERRTELFIENCKRFNEGRPLKNVVDKTNWF